MSVVNSEIGEVPSGDNDNHGDARMLQQIMDEVQALNARANDMTESSFGGLSNQFAEIAAEIAEIRSNMVPRSSLATLMRRVSELEGSHNDDQESIPESDLSFTGYSDDWPEEAWVEDD